MADDGEPLKLERPVIPARLWFVSPGEPRDFRTLCDLCSAAIADARDDLLISPRASQLLAAIGKHGREGHIRALEGEVAATVSRHLSKPKTRQPVKGAFVEYHAVPLPKSGRLEGVMLIRAWTHCYRTSFAPIIGK